jgi:hypothetical protein
MHDLDILPAKESGRAKNETELARPFPRRHMKRKIAIANDLRKLAPIGTGDPNLMPETSQSCSELDRLVVRAPAGEQRVQVYDPQGPAGGKGKPGVRFRHLEQMVCDSRPG